MDFNGLLEKIKGSFTNSPSVIGNVLGGKTWNQDLPRFGGVAPESQMIQNPNVVSPLQAPDEMTPGMIHAEKMEEARPEWVQGTVVPDSGGQPVVPQPTPTPQAVLGAVDETPSPSAFEKLVIDVMTRNNIPAPVGLGIAQAEGGRVGENNPFNIQAYDSNPENAVDYKTPEEGVQGFADLINKDSRYAKALQHRDNPYEMIQAIQEGGYAGAPATWKARSVAQGGAGKNFDQWADFVRSTAPYRRFQ